MKSTCSRLSWISRLRRSSLAAGSVVLAVQMLGCATFEERAPVLNEGVRNQIPDQYLVVFKTGTSREVVLAAQSVVKRLGGTIGHTYTTALIGFSAKLPASAVQALRTSPGVAYIEADQYGRINTVQTNPPDGLDRTSERPSGLDKRYTYSETGQGVHVYVIDTGINSAHTDFSGRLGNAHDATASDVTPTTEDGHGHGTHVAGTIGGTKYGIAKEVTLHAVKVTLGSGTSSTDTVKADGADVIAGIDWVTSEVQAKKSVGPYPAVANMSVGFDSAPPPTVQTALQSSINAGVTYVIAAGNANGPPPCYWPHLALPGSTGNITVGAINPTNDTRWSDPVTGAGSNYGDCVDIFAPGANILSAWIGSASASNTMSGTSMAAPHVAGVAALYLEKHTSASPAAVWNAILYAANISGTTGGWGGIADVGTGSPNVLLHWGSLTVGTQDGDPHITTVDGLHYDFQGAGEYVSLRDQDGMEIQTRQAAIATTFNPPPNPYTGLATCVSLNTAVAARVGPRRITFQPNLSGIPDPGGLQLRVDGDLVTLGPDGLDLGWGGRVAKTQGDGIEIHFPNDTILMATPGWWASQSKWYLNVDVLRTRSSAGLMGATSRGSWLPALPDGKSLGPMPAALQQRYAELYQTFGNAWRVTDKTSLFDYAPGTSTATFTLQSWPPLESPCVIAGAAPVQPTTQQRAEQACRAITTDTQRANCIFDVRVTGNPGFAETYLLSQRLRTGSTTTTLESDQDTTQPGEWVTFTATVAPSAAANSRVPTGTVQFSLDGAKVEGQIKLDARGRATWETSRLKVGAHRVAASYVAGAGYEFLASRSAEVTHTVKRCQCESGKERKDAPWSNR